MEQQVVSQISQAPRGNHDDPIYDGYLSRIAAHFRAVVDEGKNPLFTTDVEGLWEAYLAAFPDDQRQFHACSACRHFIQRFGGLVWISEIGLTGSAIWDEDAAPELYKPAIAAMSRLVRRSNVTGVFLSSLEVWGTPQTGVWRHFAVRPLPSMIFKHPLNTAGQAMAEKREEFKTVARALADFTPPMVEQALTLLKSDALYGSEKVLGQGQWLRDLHVARSPLRGAPRDNVLWRAIADAPAGFCHPRASMIGTLLEDLALGLDFNSVAERFKKKMHPLAYQRPQAAPSAVAIAQAEKSVEKLGVARSLERRFARLDEVQALWRSTPESEPAAGGVFGHLKPKGAETPDTMVIPEQPITWEKFARTVLPEAKAIELLVPFHGNFVALTTALHGDAPPILQWDNLEQRNPVSHYVHDKGSLASTWNMAQGWTPLSAITLAPSSWHGGDFKHQGDHVMLLLPGCKDQDGSGGNAIFPSHLKAEFHAIRSTIEAYSKKAKLHGIEEASACGIMMSKGVPAGAQAVNLRVKTGNGVIARYHVDRWD